VTASPPHPTTSAARGKKRRVTDPWATEPADYDKWGPLDQLKQKEKMNSFLKFDQLECPFEFEFGAIYGQILIES